MPNTTAEVRKISTVIKKPPVNLTVAVFPAAAEPVNVLPGTLGRGSWCHEHDTIHERLDIIEEVSATALVPGLY